MGRGAIGSNVSRVSLWRNPRGNHRKEHTMADPIPAGSDVSSGTYRCTQCGNQIEVGSTKHLPPCPSCGNGEWEPVTGGDSVNDPYPNSSPAPGVSGGHLSCCRGSLRLRPDRWTRLRGLFIARWEGD